MLLQCLLKRVGVRLPLGRSDFSGSVVKAHSGEITLRGAETQPRSTLRHLGRQGAVFFAEGGEKSTSLFLTPGKTSSGNEKQKEQVLGGRGVPAGWDGAPPREPPSSPPSERQGRSFVGPGQKVHQQEHRRAEAAAPCRGTRGSTGPPGSPGPRCGNQPRCTQKYSGTIPTAGIS